MMKNGQIDRGKKMEVRSMQTEVKDLISAVIFEIRPFEYLLLIAVIVNQCFGIHDRFVQCYR